MTDAKHSAQTRLATYGTLAPGRVNYGQLADLAGDWGVGAVRGRLLEKGWGAAHGFPGIILDPEEAEVEVQILQSLELPSHWARLDAFEGPGYRRATTQARTETGVVAVSIYELAATP